MSILYTEEHRTCLNYEDEKHQTIEIKKIEAGKIYETREAQNRLIFHTKGSLFLNDRITESYPLNEKDFIFIPSNEKIQMRIIEDTELIIFRIYKQIRLCQYYQLEQLVKYKSSSSSPLHGTTVLKQNEPLSAYLQQLCMFINMGVKCGYFFNLKVDELLVLFRCFYTKEELAELFSSLLTNDISFSNYIILNSSKSQSVGQLAESMNYSVSGFEKKFKKVFGIPAYKWMKQQKARNIFDAICSDQWTFKEIAYNFGFASESYFYEFCKAEFGKTPGQIRKNE